MPKKNEKIVEAKIEEKDRISEKSYFLPRVVAYIIDIIIVTLISSLICFAIPENKNLEGYRKEYNEITDEFRESATKDKKMDIKTYYDKIGPVSYDIDYATLPNALISIVVGILYFVVFQYYNKGQTLGKKLMKLRVVSTVSNELDINQFAFRALFINSVLFDLIIVGLLLFVGSNYYFTSSLIVNGVMFLFLIISIIMVIMRKDGRGLHDFIGKTQVISDK